MFRNDIYEMFLVGVICCAPVYEDWYRAQVVNTIPETNEVDVKFLDHGGYSRLLASTVRQIRSDFMALPFQASECYLANVLPNNGKSDVCITHQFVC